MDGGSTKMPRLHFISIDVSNALALDSIRDELPLLLAKVRARRGEVTAAPLSAAKMELLL